MQLAMCPQLLLDVQHETSFLHITWRVVTVSLTSRVTVYGDHPHPSVGTLGNGGHCGKGYHPSYRSQRPSEAACEPTHQIEQQEALHHGYNWVCHVTHTFRLLRDSSCNVRGFTWHMTVSVTNP